MVHRSERESSRRDKYDKSSHKRIYSKTREHDKERERSKRHRYDERKPKKEEKKKEKVEEKTSEQTSIEKTADQILEETNKYRIEAGLKPITAEDIADEKQPLNTVSSIEEDVHRPAINIGDNQRSVKLKERLEILKEKNRLKMKYSNVQTLGNIQEDSLVDWIAKSRSLDQQKKAAAEKIQNIESFEDNVIYEDNCPSMTVLHDFERFEEGRDVILTLKDKDVLDEKEDELINVNLIDVEKGEENIRKSNIGLTYRPWDSEEFADEYNGNPFEFNNKKLLSQYNERIDGKKIKSFTLDKTGKFDLSSHIDGLNPGKVSNKGKINLTAVELKPVSDYLTPEETELKFKNISKKRKIKVRKSRRDELEFLETEIKGEPMEIKNSNKNKLAGLLPVIFSDIKEEQSEDDLTDLNFANEGEDEISMYLNQNLKMKKFNEPRDFPVSNTSKGAEDLPYKVGLVIDDLTEFCKELKTPQLQVNAGNLLKDQTIHSESDDSEEILLEHSEMHSDGNESNKEEEFPNLVDSNPLYIEPSISSGLTGAFKLAAQKGYIKQEVKEVEPQISKEAKELCSNNYSVEIRRVDEGDSKQRRNETRYEGNLTTFKEKKITPKFKLEYTNVKGEIMEPKEAFRYISHVFHGKGPGKPKLERRAKKKQDDKKFMYMNEHDTPLSSLKILKDKQKKEKSSYLVISGGKFLQSDKSSKN